MNTVTSTLSAGQQFHAMREEKGYSQQDIANIFDCSQPAISSIDQDLREMKELPSHDDGKE